MKSISWTLLGVLLSACASSAMGPRTDYDPYLWLEEVEGRKALEWVKNQSESTKEELEMDPRFETFKTQTENIYMAKDRLPRVSLQGNWLYNFWQDDKAVRGIWRRTTIAQFKTASPRWETILDLDQLAAKEKENWVWKGSNCLGPQYAKCMISLSRGGKDAIVQREFDLEKKTFVTNGFQLPEAKSNVDWYDADTLIVGTDWGPGSLTDSGYPRIGKLWKRGTLLKDAQTIYEGQTTDVSAGAYVIHRPEGRTVFAYRSLSFYTSENYSLQDLKTPIRLPIPIDATMVGPFQGKLLITLRSDGVIQGRNFKQGSLVAIDVKDANSGQLGEAEAVFEPTATEFLDGVSVNSQYVLVNTLNNVVSTIRTYSLQDGKWNSSLVNLPGRGTASISAANEFDARFMLTYSGFLEPSQLWLHDKSRTEKLKSSPTRFDASQLEVQQKWAVSKDGTKIPYFMVARKDLKLNGLNPTLLYGYGGFENAITPYYSGAIGKLWMERGGVYVVANIRGGGEFGPAWHQAALKRNRQKAFDDFIAVAEDLIRSKVTDPRHLGIEGGSNGGLLVGATFVQRPELFNAVVCEVPLLDMLRYNKLLAGASWMGEYGDPAIPEEREALARYSPYHNVDPAKNYPRVLFITSTKDDRVHPGHARKMAARMLDFKKPFLYYENTEGGHAAGANLLQQAYMTTLQFTYLSRQLGLN